MKRLVLALIGRLLFGLGLLAQSAGAAAPLGAPNEQLLSEQKHFAECLSVVYRPGWWLSYNDLLFFQPRNEVQVKQLETMKAARSRYLALTNQQTRYELAARLIAESGLSESWQRKLLLPFSATNQNLTPTLDMPLRVIPKYKILQSFGGGDALIQDGASTNFVMDFGRGADDASCTNALLVREGKKACLTDGRFMSFEAFADVGLSREETAVLNRVAAAFQKEATTLGQKIDTLKAGQEFEEYKTRANDNSPYLEYLLAKAYLEGRGTEKNEQLGLDWMNRAAGNGSGDAQSYLEALARKSH